MPLDRHVDVYALGVVLYELLTGCKPFEATTDASIMRAILSLIRMLRNLGHILQKAAAFAEKERMSPELLLERRLHPDMFSLSRGSPSLSSPTRH